MPLGELGSDSTLQQDKPKQPPKAAPASTPAPSTPIVTSTPVKQPPVPQTVIDDIGMMTGALTTFEDLFGSGPSTDGLVAPTQVQTQVIESLSISDEDKTKLLSGLTPEQAKAVDEQAPYVDKAGGFRYRGLGSGWDAPLYALQGETPPVNPDLAEAQQADDSRAVRAKALGVDNSGAALNGKTPKAKEMTWDEYNALDPRQRAAVDFNTMLTTAVRRDMRKSDKLMDKRSDDEIATYDARVAAIFGEDGGSEIFAPETVALLDQIQFKDEAADLDDFLGLKTVIRGKDLGRLDDVAAMRTAGVPTPADPSATGERNALQLRLAESTQEMQEAVVKSQALLDSTKKMMAADRYEHIGMLGGNPREVNAPLGYGQGRFDEGSIDLDQDFRLVFDALADAKNAERFSEILGIAQSKFETVNPRTYGKFLDYASTRSQQALDFQLPLGENPNVAQYLTPDEFRVKLGLAPKESADARR